LLHQHGYEIDAMIYIFFVMIPYDDIFSSMYQIRAKQKSLELTWDVTAEVPNVLIGDAGRLQQCILNLGKKKI
jgi:hypothetical protein